MARNWADARGSQHTRYVRTSWMTCGSAFAGVDRMIPSPGRCRTTQNPSPVPSLLTCDSGGRFVGVLVRVLVGVRVRVLVGVLVRVRVGALVRVLVGVVVDFGPVAVAVAVMVGVAVGVAVALVFGVDG